MTKQCDKGWWKTNTLQRNWLKGWSLITMSLTTCGKSSKLWGFRNLSLSSIEASNTNGSDPTTDRSMSCSITVSREFLVVLLALLNKKKYIIKVMKDFKIWILWHARNISEYFAYRYLFISLLWLGQHCFTDTFKSRIFRV